MQSLRPRGHHRPLSYRCFQMEPHRAPVVLRDLQKLGSRASGQLRKDAQIHSRHPTKTGLAVTAYLDRNEYQTHLKPDPQLISSLAFTPGKVIPRWNYTIRPNL